MNTVQLQIPTEVDRRDVELADPQAVIIIGCALSVGTMILNEMLRNNIDKPTCDTDVTTLLATAFLNEFKL